VGALLGFYGAFAVLVVALSLVLPDPWLDGSWGMAVSVLAMLVAAAVVNLTVVIRGWGTWKMLGWNGGVRDRAALAFGTVLGLAIAFVAVSIAVVVGGARIELTGESFGAYLGVAGRIGIVLLLAALAEELLFRGYPLARLAAPMGKVGASVVLAAVFAAAHGLNPEVSALGLVNIALASLVLSAAFFTPGGLPLAWGVHFGWNGGLALGADAPVSGLTFDIPALEFVTGRSAWVTGGTFGPEGGIAASVAMAVALIWLSQGHRQAEKGERI
jgi:membrane protease YdiL (CAAX protease family)